MSIVPWWYALLLTILYAEPETYWPDQHELLSLRFAETEAYLIFPDAYIISIVNIGVDA